MSTPEKKPADPGRTVRVVCTWVVGILLAATVAHLLMLPPKKEAEQPASENVGAQPSAEADGSEPLGDSTLDSIRRRPRAIVTREAPPGLTLVTASPAA